MVTDLRYASEQLQLARRYATGFDGGRRDAAADAIDRAQDAVQRALAAAEAQQATLQASDAAGAVLGDWTAEEVLRREG